MRRVFTWVGRRRVSPIVVGGLSLVLNAGISTLVRLPHPAFHDEFSY